MVVSIFIITDSQKITVSDVKVCKSLYVEKISDSVEESEHSKDVEKESIHQKESLLKKGSNRNKFTTVFEDDRTKVNSPLDKPPQIV